jgi:hypothetical protein
MQKTNFFIFFNVLITENGKLQNFRNMFDDYIIFCQPLFSPLNTLMRKGKDPDPHPYPVLVTNGSGGSGRPKNILIRIWIWIRIRNTVGNRVSDPHRFNADPDTDPDPAFFLIADPDPDPGSGSRV